MRIPRIKTLICTKSRAGVTVTAISGLGGLFGCGGSGGEQLPPGDVGTVTVALNTGVPNGYVLVWSDEFNTNGIQLPDASKWSYDTSRNSLGWFNNELQYYASGRLQNSVVQNGILTIRAHKESLSGMVADWGGQSYTSARLVTKGKASWTYGFLKYVPSYPAAQGLGRPSGH